LNGQCRSGFSPLTLGASINNGCHKKNRAVDSYVKARVR
jgi:hypothetical protein